MRRQCVIPFLSAMFGVFVSEAHSVTPSVSLRSAQHSERTILTLSCPSNRITRLADPDRVRPVFSQFGADFHDAPGAKTKTIADKLVRCFHLHPFFPYRSLVGSQDVFNKYPTRGWCNHSKYLSCVSWQWDGQMNSWKVAKIMEQCCNSYTNT